MLMIELKTGFCLNHPINFSLYPVLFYIGNTPPEREESLIALVFQNLGLVSGLSRSVYHSTKIACMFLGNF